MLERIHVVDFTTLLPGPYATLRLADLGATVVKIEPPGGDPARYIGQTVEGTSLGFMANNRDKTRLVLDLKNPVGQSEALAMTKTADVVVEGFRPGVADRLGIGYDVVRQANPDVVYCSLTGYGQTGPLKHLAAHDLNYLAVSGMLDQFVDRQEQPIVPKIQLADLLGGIAATEAILAALVERSQTGRGQHLDIAMVDALMGLLGGHALIQTTTGYTHGVEELGGAAVCYNVYETLDNRFISLGALEAKFWETFCHAVGHPEWIPHQLSSAEPSNSIYNEMVSLFKQHPLAFWTSLGQHADCCLQPVLNVGEAFSTSYAIIRNLVSDRTTSWGTLRHATTGAGGYRRPANEYPAIDND